MCDPMRLSRSARFISKFKVELEILKPPITAHPALDPSMMSVVPHANHETRKDGMPQIHALRRQCKCICVVFLVDWMVD